MGMARDGSFGLRNVPNRILGLLICGIKVSRFWWPLAKAKGVDVHAGLKHVGEDGGKSFVSGDHGHGHRCVVTVAPHNGSSAD
jgi:hypothetical protein